MKAPLGKIHYAVQINPWSGMVWLRDGPAAAAAVGFLLDVAVDVEVAARLCDGRHGHVLVGLPQEASSAVRE